MRRSFSDQVAGLATGKSVSSLTVINRAGALWPYSTRENGHVSVASSHNPSGTQIAQLPGRRLVCSHGRPVYRGFRGGDHYYFLEYRKEFSMLGLILLIIVILLLLGAFPAWPHARSWGYGPSGILGVLLVILLVLMLFSVITPPWGPTYVVR
jgi:hypothetical protein